MPKIVKERRWINSPYMARLFLCPDRWILAPVQPVQDTVLQRTLMENRRLQTIIQNSSIAGSEMIDMIVNERRATEEFRAKTEKLSTLVLDEQAKIKLLEMQMNQVVVDLETAKIDLAFEQFKNSPAPFDMTTPVSTPLSSETD
jgi:hypothetical protein